MAGVAGAAAQPAEDLAGKQLSIAIGYGTGGTYYTYAKLIADHLGRFVPGRPPIIVQSMPGAGGVRMLNTAARVMAGDGTQLFVPPDTMVLAQLTAKDGIQFDARRFHYIGTINQQNNFFVVRRSAGTSLAEFRSREVIVGHSGIGSAGHLIPSLARETLGIKVRLIAGFQGSRDTLLAMERGETESGTFGWETWAQTVPQWFEGPRTFAVPLFQLGTAPDPDQPTVPLLSTLVSPADRPLVALFETQSVIGRSLALPPSASAAMVAMYRKALASMLTDQAFRDEAEKRRLRLMPVAGGDLQMVVERAIAGSDAALIARARAMVSE